MITARGNSFSRYIEILRFRSFNTHPVLSRSGWQKELEVLRSAFRRIVLPEQEKIMMPDQILQYDGGLCFLLEAVSADVAFYRPAAEFHRNLSGAADFEQEADRFVAGDAHDDFQLVPRGCDFRFSFERSIGLL